GLQTYRQRRTVSLLSLEEDKGGPDFGIAPVRVGVGEEVELGCLQGRGGVAGGLQRPAIVESLHELFRAFVVDVPERDEHLAMAALSLIERRQIVDAYKRIGMLLAEAFFSAFQSLKRQRHRLRIFAFAIETDNLRVRGADCLCGLGGLRGCQTE